MGIFKKIFGGGAALRLDPALGDEQIASARAALDRGDIGPARSLLAEQTHPHRRDFAVQAIAPTEMTQAILEGWVRKHPEDVDGLIVAGVTAINWAWDARGRAGASSVTQDAAQLFLERLTLAGQLLTKATQLRPDEPLGFAQLIAVNKGLNIEPDQTRQVFDKAAALCPDHWTAHASMHSYLCKKWHGSHEAMFAFARERVAACPTSPHLQGLIPMSHAERWYSAAVSGEQDVTTTYFTDSAVIDELNESFKGYLAHGGDGGHAVLAGNYFAFCLNLAEQKDAARQAFEKIGDRPTEFPWRMLRDVIGEFELARKDCGYK